MTPRYVVLSAPRSGTGYAARVLTRAGLDCGHEQWWGSDVPEAHCGDASWLALPDVEAGLFDGVVAAQVRRPLDVVASLAQADLWRASGRAYLDHALRHSSAPSPCRPPRTWSPHDRLAWAVGWVADWMARCLRVSELAWRVEDFGPATVADLADRLPPLEPDPAQVAGVLDAVPRDVNHRAPVRPLTWGAVAGLPGWGRLARLSRSLGYDAPPA